MTAIIERPTLEFDEPAGVGPRGTLIVLPGRGDSPGVYARFGARIAVDAYRVRVVHGPAELADTVAAAVGPVVLVGIDTGAIDALRAVQDDGIEAAALVLVGLPSAGDRGPTEWEDEVTARASCPTQQARLRSDDLVEVGRLARPVEDDVVLASTRPILALHGADDSISPLAQAKSRYAGASNVRLLSVADGRHDVLNSLNHRTVAASVVLFLESLRAETELVEEVAL
ncbi:alpha/beta hydrolase [Rhodococcus sp. IEGM1428]|uniref:alpha/beta hydrolase n=1 Tax=Rhodococcus sp. IEGM1428 TaxID=3392191 RepID=UPI003D0F849B